MEIPHIWGQGQIFAFSALDGNVYRSFDFAGTLSGDRIGIRFNTKIRRELAMTGLQEGDIAFRAVCGDYIHAETVGGDLKIIFSAAHLVIGQLPEGAAAVVFTEGKCKTEDTGGSIVQDTGDGEYTALALSGNRFAFACSDTKLKAVKTAKEGLCVDILAEEEKKLSFYRKHSTSPVYSDLYAKCLSVMRTQLFSPESIFSTIWSTPDRLPHQDLFLWDSVFHGIGFRNVDGNLAENVILAMLESIQENGMIPCRSKILKDGNIFSKESQPPIIAWGTWMVYEKTKNLNFLRTVFPKNILFLQWCRENRRHVSGLYAWFVDENTPICRCGESGMDNSPRFDKTANLLAIDFSCYMANEMRFMARIAEEIGEDSAAWKIEYQSLKQMINKTLWDEESGFYYDYDINKGQLHKVKSVASFLPFFAGACEGERSRRLASHLTNPKEFYAPVPIPTISADDRTYGSDMWRGPVWINFNFMICEGLRKTGFGPLATEITEKTLQTIYAWYKETGVIFEFYDSENKKPPYSLRRKGDPVEPYDMRVRVQTIRDFGWSCCLTLDMIAQLNNQSADSADL